jgi:hypothetical protein
LVAAVSYSVPGVKPPAPPSGPPPPFKAAPSSDKEAKAAGAVPDEDGEANTGVVIDVKAETAVGLTQAEVERKKALHVANIEFTLACRSLIKMDLFSKSDPIVLLYDANRYAIRASSLLFRSILF